MTTTPAMWKVGLVVVWLALVLASTSAQSWSGQVCSRTVCKYRRKVVCAYRSLGNCCAYKTIWEGYWATEFFCCRGWYHTGDRNCNIPICIPSCQNGGVCDQPGKCRCPSTHTGYRCSQAVCSYQKPCFPGNCYDSDSCDCSSGFTTSPAGDKARYCLKIVDDANTNLQLTEMQVRMSYWPRSLEQPLELHRILADSTMLQDDEMDVLWTNRRDFNRLETTFTSQYFPPTLTDYPPYVDEAKFGVVGGRIEVWLKKLQPGGAGGATFTSLNKTIPCLESVSNTSPETNVYNCSIVDENFDRFLEHRDALKVIFYSDGGGYRRLRNVDTNSLYGTQTYESVSRMLAVEFRFDFLLPHHCEEYGTCSTSAQSMLDVPDITKENPITIRWNGWQDEDSQMFRYAWEVFRMTKTTDGGLEIQPSLALSPLINQEVMAADYAPQSYQLPGPGMYSVILEAGDRANNTQYVRRLVLFDPDPRITSDPQHAFYVSTASASAGYRYQNDVTGDVIVTWERHFRNALHEENNLLGHVRRYPTELRDGNTAEGSPRFKKDIPTASRREDHEGERTVDEIANKRGIVNFAVQSAKDHDGGLRQPEVPGGPWQDLSLATSYTVPQVPSEADTVTVWVRATDVMGTERVERTQVTFDSTAPEVVKGIQFRMNVPVAGIHFSSQFAVETKDEESGIAYIQWTFTRVSNNSVIYEERVEGIRVSSCSDLRCSCTTTGECFPFRQVFSVSNCHMMVEKENLDTETINVTADVTNMAGLVTRLSMLKDDLTKLNGTEAYFPPQNIEVKDITTSNVTLTWTFPPSCFPRTGTWVIIDGVRHAVDKDATEFAATGLSSGTNYTIYLVIDYEGDVQSDRASVKVSTVEPGREAGGAGRPGADLAWVLLAAVWCFFSRSVLC